VGRRMLSSIKAVGCAVSLVFVLAAPAEAAQARNRVAPSAPPSPVSPPYRGADRFPTGPVTYGNKYLGTDPDPFIRQQLLRDLGAQF
jgi:hypothetical protein